MQKNEIQELIDGKLNVLKNDYFFIKKSNVIKWVASVIGGAIGFLAVAGYVSYKSFHLAAEKQLVQNQVKEIERWHDEAKADRKAIAEIVAKEPWKHFSKENGVVKVDAPFFSESISASNVSSPSNSFLIGSDERGGVIVINRRDNSLKEPVKISVDSRGVGRVQTFGRDD